MGRELIRWVVTAGAAGLLPLALAGYVAAGPPGAFGVLAGGAIALGNLWLLGRSSDRALALLAGRHVHPLWVVSLGLRYLALFGVVAALLWSGRVHPVGLIVGLSILPPVLIAYALRGSRGVA